VKHARHRRARSLRLPRTPLPGTALRGTALRGTALPATALPALLLGAGAVALAGLAVSADPQDAGSRPAAAVAALPDDAAAHLSDAALQEAGRSALRASRDRTRPDPVPSAEPRPSVTRTPPSPASEPVVAAAAPARPAAPPPPARPAAPPPPPQPAPPVPPPAAAPAEPPAAPAPARAAAHCPVPSASFTDTWGAPRSGGRSHAGTDLMAAHGAPVHAVTSGVVRVSSSSNGGLSLYLTADDGERYFYAHNSVNLVASGQRVAAGDLVARVGNTGNARGTDPHVHFERQIGGRAVNPYAFLRDLCG